MRKAADAAAVPTDVRRSILRGEEGQIGVLIIGILNNGLNLMGVNSDWQYIIKGAVILLAVYTDFLRSRKKVA